MCVGWGGGGGWGSRVVEGQSNPDFGKSKLFHFHDEF